MGYDLYIEKLAKTDIENYYTLNLYNIGLLRRDMHLRNMLDITTNEPTFPYPDDYGVTDGMWKYRDKPLDPKTPVPMRRFLADEKKVTDAQAKTPTGIPAYKLSSNDGWLITPGEISSALRSLENNYLDDHLYTRWEDWIDFLRRGAAHGGIRVY